MQFSILIAHYNNWNYFQECYQSIKSQTIQDYEIIIVDDCSTDGSFYQLLELTKLDSKLKLFQNPENKKVGYTKKKCVEEAQGKICFFVDPDDFLAPNALSEIAEAYNDNPNIIATYSRIELIDTQSKSKGLFNKTKKIENKKSNFFNINFEIAHLFSFKKEAYEKTSKINETLTSAVDQDLYLKLYELGNFYFINKVQYYYRIHDKGVSQNQSQKEKLNKNWHQVILDTCKRRNIQKLYSKNISQINNLPDFIYKKENTFLKKVLKRIL